MNTRSSDHKTTGFNTAHRNPDEEVLKFTGIDKSCIAIKKVLLPDFRFIFCSSPFKSGSAPAPSAP